MRVFVDTSAFYALAAENDRAHRTAQAIHEELKRTAVPLVTTNYVLLECISLLQRRHGVEHAERFGDFVGQQVDVVWLTQDQHRAAWANWKQRGIRKLSLVDCSCFVVMRQLGIQHAFAFDEQFPQAGFTVLNPPQSPDRVEEPRGRYRVKRRSRARSSAH